MERIAFYLKHEMLFGRIRRNELAVRYCSLAFVLHIHLGTRTILFCGFWLTQQQVLIAT